MSDALELLKKVYCRLGVSTIHGVGVFAIRHIPKGIDPMLEERQIEFYSVPVEQVDGSVEIGVGIKNLVRDMCPQNDGCYELPRMTLNEIGVSYYLNHSKTPNMDEDGDGNFVANRDIEVGEELTVDYGTYGELNL